MRRLGLVLLFLIACSDSPPPATATPVACAPDAAPSVVVAPREDAGAVDASPEVGAPDATVDAAPPDAAVPDATVDAPPDVVPDVITGASPLLKPRLYCYGNSLTNGFGATNPTTDPYPVVLASLLGDTWESAAWKGRNGASASQLYFTAPHDLDAFDTEERSRRVLVFWEGTNDVPVSPYTVDAHEAITRRAVAHGWTVVLMTMLPRMPLGGDIEARRLALNDAIRAEGAGWGAADFVDLAADPAFVDPTNLTYFRPDGLHLNTTGYARVAELVKPVVDALYLPPVP